MAPLRMDAIPSLAPMRSRARREGLISVRGVQSSRCIGWDQPFPSSQQGPRQQCLAVLATVLVETEDS